MVALPAAPVPVLVAAAAAVLLAGSVTVAQTDGGQQGQPYRAQ
jgi:hypothetical protein